jgi:hypothetical protein
LAVLELPDQLQPAALQVYVLPAQPEQLTLAHAGGDGHHVQRFQPVAGTSGPAACGRQTLSPAHQENTTGSLVNDRD